MRLTSAHVCQFLKVILVTVHPSLKRSQYFEDATHSIHKSINHICTTTTANHISEHQEQECKQSVLPRLLKLVVCNRLVIPLHLYQLNSTQLFVPIHTQLHFFSNHHYSIAILSIHQGTEIYLSTLNRHHRRIRSMDSRRGWSARNSGIRRQGTASTMAMLIADHRAGVNGDAGGARVSLVVVGVDALAHTLAFGIADEWACVESRVRFVRLREGGEDWE